MTGLAVEGGRGGRERSPGCVRVCFREAAALPFNRGDHRDRHADLMRWGHAARNAAIPREWAKDNDPGPYSTGRIEAHHVDVAAGDADVVEKANDQELPAADGSRRGGRLGQKGPEKRPLPSASASLPQAATPAAGHKRCLDPLPPRSSKAGSRR